MKVSNVVVVCLALAGHIPAPQQIQIVPWRLDVPCDAIPNKVTWALIVGNVLRLPSSAVPSPARRLVMPSWGQVPVRAPAASLIGSPLVPECVD